MKLRCVFVFSLFLLCLIFSSENAKACSCVRQEVCQYFSNAKVVFVGKVLDTTERTRIVKRREKRVGSDEWEENEYVEKRQISRVKIEENFIGTNGKNEILVETEISSSCALSLQKDVTYLIYANPIKTEENLTTHFCSGTKPVSSAQEDLSYLRANKNNGAVVSGEVGFGDWWKLNPAPLLNYGVTTVSLEKQGELLQAEIKRDGSYNFSNVPQGKYKIKVILPDSLTTADKYHPDIAEELEVGDQSEIVVDDHGCFKEDFLILENGRISGQITDGEGKPIKDITVNLIPISKTGQKIKQEEPCYDTDLCLNTDENGNYFFKGLKAGRYLVGVRLDDYVDNNSVDAAFLKTYYPGASTEKSAVSVSVKFGKLTDNINFKLTRKYKEREIRGRVFFKDGRLAPRVNVRYVARTPDLKDNGITFIKTDENGYFSITGYENHAYLIGAFTDARDGNESLEAFTVVVNVLPKKEVKEVKLVLDQDMNRDCKKCGDYHEFPKTKTRNK
jgi:hypothetical protein